MAILKRGFASLLVLALCLSCASAWSLWPSSGADDSAQAESHSVQAQVEELAEEEVSRELAARPIRALILPAPVSKTYNVTSSQIAPVCVTAGIPTLTLSPALSGDQAWSGWGTSLGWWTNALATVNATTALAVSNLLFSVKGLKLNIVRYNIGGGQSPKFKSTKQYKEMVKNDKYSIYKFLPGFKANSAAPVDPTADVIQRRFLLAAKLRGANLFIGFSKSPPYWLTASGDTTGAKYVSSKPLVSNLPASNYQAFADYLADVAAQFAAAKVPFTYLEPVNQPETAYWAGSNSNQEGCSFQATDVNTLLGLVAASLKKRKLKTKVAIPDTSVAAFPSYLTAVSAANLAQAGAVFVHAYEAGGSKVKNPIAKSGALSSAVASAAKAAGKPLWMTEYGPNNVDGDDLGVALYTARKIIEGVNILKASAWLHWQAIDAADAWTLIKFNWDNPAGSALQLTKKYEVLRAFSTNVPRGSWPLRPSSTNPCTLATTAFYSPCTKRVIFFGVNQGASAQRVNLRLSQFKKAVFKAKIVVATYRVSATINNVLTRAVSISLKSDLRVTLPPMALTTVVFRNLVVSSKEKAQLLNVCPK